MSMRSRPSPAGMLGIAALVIFTLWINWRVKAMGTASDRHSSNVALLKKPAPEFSLLALDGRSMPLTGFRGRNLVVTFWASWCGPCRMELPVLRTFYQKAHKSDADFEIVAISIDQSANEARTAAGEFKLPFPVLLDSAGKTAEAYGVDAIPSLFVIDKQGVVQYASTGFDMNLEIMLATQLGIKNYSAVTIGEEK